MRYFAFVATALCLSINAFGQSTAHFSNFSYAGDDAYYRTRELADSTEFYNPVIAGWSSDPSVVRVGDDYWLVTSTFGYFPGVPLYHSNDLVHWELVRNILDRPSQAPGLPGQSIDKGGIYAAHISYNPANGLYYMVTTDTGSTPCHFYVTASDPCGDWSDPVWLDNIDGIDPSFFFDDDLKAYIVYKEDTANRPKWSPYRCIRFIEFDVASGRTVGESWPLYEPDVAPDERLDRAEGPHIYKVNGRYYLITAEGGTGDQHSANIYGAPALRGPWQRSWRSPILTQRNLKPKRTNPVTCAGHADLVQTPQGDWWAVFLAQRPGPGNFQHLGRETYLMPVKWGPDGYPYITQAMDTVPLVQSRPGIGNEPFVQAGNFEWHDNFTSPNLAPEWIGLRGPVNSMELKGDGRLTLRCMPEKASGRGVPQYLGRRLQHHAFSASVVVDFAPSSPTERAGMLLFKNEAAHLFLASDGANISLTHTSRHGDTTIASAPIDRGASGPVELAVMCDGVHLSFSFRLAGSDRWTLLADNVDASIISCDRTGGFTGATIGMYAVDM